MTAGELLRVGRQHLQGVSPSVALDVRLLLCHTLDIDDIALFREPERLVTDAQQNIFLALLRRRIEGQPIAYLLGRRAFYDADFKVTKDTLIPRPDTELLVERVLALLPIELPGELSDELSEKPAETQSQHSSQTALSERPPIEVADLGTGCGIIAITLARLRSAWQLLAVDQSEAALDVARTNAQSLHAANVRFHRGSWLTDITQRFDAIACNPPYIAADDHHLTQGDVRFEPVTALVADEAGLADIRQVSIQATQSLKPGGWLVFEHGFEQAAQVRELLHNNGFIEVASHRDLGGHERVTEGRKPC